MRGRRIVLESEKERKCVGLHVRNAEFLSQRMSGAVLMKRRHGEGQTDKQEAVSEKKE